MRRIDAQLALLAPLALTAVAPTPPVAVAGLAAGSTAGLVDLVALAAWTCSAWLLLVVLLTVLSGVGGSANRAATWPARASSWLLGLLAPATVRTTARVALGVTLATAGLGATTAFAAEPLPSARPSAGPGASATAGTLAPDLDWPRLAAAQPTPPAPLDPSLPVQPSGAAASAIHPSSAPTGTVPRGYGPVAPSESAPAIRPRPTAPYATVRTTTPGSAVVVRAGDCLWDIAARTLGASATPARIARSWPSWWAANRAVIGDDPDLLQPGTRLVPPER